MFKQNISIQRAKVIGMGLTFKENVPDLRNSKVIDVIRELSEYDMEVQVTDLVARDKESIKQFGIKLIKTKADAVILAVPHREYIQGGWGLIRFVEREEWNCSRY